MSTPLDAPSDRAGHTPDRQCGRCRRWFPGDAALHPVALAEWWACPTCRDSLLGKPTLRSVVQSDDPNRATPAEVST